MPTYDYRCKACGAALEIFQSMSESPKRKCPTCGKLALERLIGAGAGFIFKGSGFYETDYRSDSYRSGEKKESEAASKKDGDASSSKKDGGSSTPKKSDSSKSDGGGGSKKKPSSKD